MNTAAVTVDGGEIGRAPALQALERGVPLHSDMNPVLLKPESDVGTQVNLQGKRLTTAAMRDYFTWKPKALGKVPKSFRRLKSAHDPVIVVGAGSPAEVSLRISDIANMWFALEADVPVVLVGDFDRGGVIAQIIGVSALGVGTFTGWRTCSAAAMHWAFAAATI